PELLGELAGRGLVIARDDRYLPDAERSKTMNNAAHPGPYQRPQFNRAAELVVDGDHRHRMAFAMHFVERRFDLTRQRHTFHFHKPTAANAHPAHIAAAIGEDRKSTRLNSSHVAISYAVFCLKKKKEKIHLL